MRMTAMQSAFITGGIFTFVLAGVRLYIDQRLEVLYIEVEPDHERWALKEIEGIAEELGFEVMPEWECPAEQMSSGAVRHWLAQKEVVDDSSSLQTV